MPTSSPVPSNLGPTSRWSDPRGCACPRHRGEQHGHRAALPGIHQRRAPDPCAGFPPDPLVALAPDRPTPAFLAPAFEALTFT